ncbi:MAG: QacE family quaternary ammonium compound efflux SMR transporter [Desulfuromonas sp.]|nr:MAG: QacE family quaternary ammonium compound efflux SMR transporter [Desulfuromonas sp.]
MGWTYVIIAGLFEVFFAYCLKSADNFSRFWPVLGFVLGVVGSLYFLSRAMQTIPLGTAYAVWTGIGCVGTVILGILLFDDLVNFWRLFFLSILIASLVGLKFFSGEV